MTLRMRQPAPTLAIATVGGGHFALADATPKNFTMIVFYRGVHCPICKIHLGEIQSELDRLDAMGVESIAVSVDPLERADRAKAEWGLDRLKIGYGMSIETARSWDLYISTGTNDQQLPLYSEPGLFLIKPDGTLYFAATSSAPWGRPSLHWLIGGIGKSLEMGWPARGEA